MVVNKPEKIKGCWYEVTGICSDRDFWFRDVTLRQRAAAERGVFLLVCSVPMVCT